MGRVRWRDFNKGLWVAGGRDDNPAGSLRRAIGISQIKETSLRSARGVRTVNLYAANQYIRFDDALYQGAGADVLRDGIVINAAFPQSGVLGLGGTQRLSFLRMPPQADLVDWLFVAGGNNPFKCQADGSTPSKWGIDAPADGMVATTDSATGVVKPISACDDATKWVRVEGAGAAFANEATITVSAGSIVVSFTDAGTNRYVNTSEAAFNGNNFGTAPDSLPSADQDYIEFWIRLSGLTDAGPQAENFDWMEVAFALGSTSFKDNVFTRRIDGQDGTVPQAGLADQFIGVGSYATAKSQADSDIVNGVGIYGSGADTRDILNAIAESVVYRQNDVWQRVRLAKNTFDRTGSDTTLDWSDVQAARFTFKRSGGLTIYMDSLSLAGGYGLQGNYKYYQVYKNSTTGSRSNPNATPVQINGMNRGRVALGNIQQPTDPQVDKIEIYRTVGNGGAYFLAFEVDVGTIGTFDTVVDFRGMYTSSLLNESELPDVLQPDEVKLDNAPPPTTIIEALGHPHLARAWWLDSNPANRGNVYYSPAGRPESNAGFVSVTTQTDNILQAIARWNDSLYVFSNQGLYRIVGDDEPFVAQEVYGVPGTVQPDTVVETPFGLVWMATDGVRIFDGTQSTMLGNDALGPLFRGYSAENLPPFEGVTAAYFKEDYWISNGVVSLIADGGAGYTLALHLPTQTWRAAGLIARTLYAPDDDTELLSSTNYVAPGLTIQLEGENADTGLAFEIQTPSVLASVDTEGIVQRVFVDIDTGGLQVTPTLIFDSSEVALAPLATTERTTVEFARLDLSRLIGVRLTCPVVTPPTTILVYGIESDIYLPTGAADQ